LLNGPFDEAIELKLSFLIGEFFEFIGWFLDFHSKLFETWNYLDKIFKKDFAIKIWIDASKGNPVFVIQPEISEEVMELDFLNVFFCTVGLGFVFGIMISSDDSMLISIKIQRKFKVSFASLNSLVHIEQFI
jgi:hypothetical protein